MASTSSSSSSIPFTVTKEQFKMFHNIDRILFTKLVNLGGRNPIECMQVIALWIWMEHSGLCRDLVNAMLTWPDALISSLADEALWCLSCIESDDDDDELLLLPFSLQQNIEVPLTQSITSGKVSLSFFRDNRLKILHGVTKNVTEVCTRAFEDLLGFDPYDIAIQRQQHDVFRNEIDEMLRRMQISSSSSNSSEQGGPADERTIFLTFSKGYPISENEIREFFTRKYGDCFEAIHMQEVPSTEQPLYARLVAYSASFMDVMLEGKSKAKFSINGKHVWARKYVRKFHRSPPRPSSPSQPPPSSQILP